MKFLLVSKCGEGCGVASRLCDEGNKVRVFIEDPVYKNVYDGILDKVKFPVPEKDEITFFDMSGFGKLADDLKSSGHLVYNGSSFADKLEHDRAFGLEVMKRCGIQVPLTEEFKDWNTARQFIEANKKKRLCFKPSGTMPCKLTYVSEDSEDLLLYLDFVEKKFKKDIKSFVLQEFVEGSLVSTEAFCNGNEFLFPFNHTVETKKFMNKDLGPSTGCSSNLVWLTDWTDPTVIEGVGLVEDICRANDYVGQIDLNAVVNEKGVWGLEWTPRFGYDATPTLLDLFQMDFGEVISNCARGESFKLNFRDVFAAAVRLTIPPYPVESEKDTEKLSPNKDIPLHDYEDFLQNLYFYEVYRDSGQLLHSGGTGVICCAVTIGERPDECIEECYEILDEIKIPDKQYRTDASEVLLKMYNDIRETINAARS